MTNAFSTLSLKRNRKKESKFNAMLSKLTNPFHAHKKRRQNDRRSSLSTFIDYFRTEEQDHPFANDALFEHNRYKQQKNLNHPVTNTCILSSSPQPQQSILIKKPIIHHRHTNSTPITTTKRKQHIRHYSHVSCISATSTHNLTTSVNSEDLTAKEFADIAGIRILSEDDDTHTCEEKICTNCGDNDRMPSLVVTSRISNSSMIRGSDGSSIYYCPPDEEEEEPQIWDNQFWRKPGQQDTLMMPPILHELKHHQDTFLKKGRFEIHLSSAAVIPTYQPVYEWKRKPRLPSPQPIT